jgi:hypothetical protein
MYVFASGKYLATANLAFAKSKSSGFAIFNHELIAASLSVNAYFAHKLFVFISFKNPSCLSLMSIVMAPCFCIFPETGSNLAKNLWKRLSFPSPIPTVPIFGSIARYLIFLFFNL